MAQSWNKYMSFVKGQAVHIILVFMLLLCFSFYFTFWLCNKNQVLEYNGWLFAPRINLLNIKVYWYVFKIRTGFVCKSNGVLIFFLKNFKKSKKMPYFKFYVFDLFFVVIVYFAWIVCIHSYVNVFHYIFSELWIHCRVCLWNRTCTYKLLV